MATRVQKIRKMAKAVAHMEKALALLTEVSEDPSNHHFLTADCGYYKNEVSEMLSCDHGEAGLQVFTKILLSKIEQGYYE